MRVVPILFALSLSTSVVAGGGIPNAQRQETRQQVIESELERYQAPQRVMDALHVEPTMGHAPVTAPATVLAADTGFQIQVFVQLAEINKDLTHLTDVVKTSSSSHESEVKGLNDRIKELETERDKLWGLITYGGGLGGVLSVLGGLFGLKIARKRKDAE